MIYQDWMRNCNSNLIYRYWLNQAQNYESITIDNITYHKFWFGVYKTMRNPFLDLIPLASNNLNKNNTMEQYQKRVITEKDELDIKLAGLTKFLESDKTSGMDSEELLRMQSQKEIMGNYSQVLGERIANFEERVTGTDGAPPPEPDKSCEANPGLTAALPPAPKGSSANPTDQTPKGSDTPAGSGGSASTTAGNTAGDVKDSVS